MGRGVPHIHDRIKFTDTFPEDWVSIERFEKESEVEVEAFVA
jgi:hypothetical protein